MDSARSAGSSITSNVPGSMWSKPVAVARYGAQTSAASPTASARVAPPTLAGAVSRRGSSAPSKRARSAASRSGSFRAIVPSRSRSSATPPGGSRNSLAGSSTASSTGPIVRWSVGSNARSESISSPKNSSRIGSGRDGGKTSTMPPRRANSPLPATSRTGTYPRSSSSRRSASWLTRAPSRTLRTSAGRSSGAIVCWRRAWTLATRIRARPLRHAASDATRAAVSSATSSLRS